MTKRLDDGKTLQDLNYPIHDWDIVALKTGREGIETRLFQECAKSKSRKCGQLRYKKIVAEDMSVSKKRR